MATVFFDNCCYVSLICYYLFNIYQSCDYFPMKPLVSSCCHNMYNDVSVGWHQQCNSSGYCTPGAMSAIFIKPTLPQKRRQFTLKADLQLITTGPKTSGTSSTIIIQYNLVTSYICASANIVTVLLVVKQSVAIMSSSI